MILPTCGNYWVPNNLNIAVPRSCLFSMSSFFRNIGYQLTDTGVDDRYVTSGVFSFSTYSLNGRIVTISESAYSGSFLSIVLASLHTGNMNFVTSSDICCLYLTITPSKKSCSFDGLRGLSENERLSVSSHGFILHTSSEDLESPCQDLCPRFIRQFRGLKRISLFTWRGPGRSSLGDVSYSWFTGTKCNKTDCIVNAQAAILDIGNRL